MNTRRKFLFDCSAMVTAGALLPWTSAGMPLIWDGGVRSLDELSYSDFVAQIQTRFQVRLAPSLTVGLKLLKAPSDATTRQFSSQRPPLDADNEKFSLIFSGPKGQLLESAIHQFEHSRLGRFEMFISPIGTGYENEVRYQAGFNRPPPTQSNRA